MEQKIKEIVKKKFGAETLEIKKLTDGYSHFMYEVEINKKPNVIIVRFSNNKKEEVNLGKEKYVSELLRKNKIPVPKIYVFDRKEDYLIQEKIQGARLDTIWESLTKEEKMQITTELGKLLSNIHAIKLAKFGYILDKGRIKEDVSFKFKQTEESLPHSPYLRALLKGYFTDLCRLVSYKYLPAEFFEDYIKFIYKNLSILDYNENPILNHGDFMTGHIFVEKEGGKYKIIGLIDFELATSYSSETDFIKLHRQGFFEDKELKEALIQGYGQINERAVEILRIIRDISFAQVNFESGNKETGDKVIQEAWEKIKALKS